MLETGFTGVHATVTYNEDRYIVYIRIYIKMYVYGHVCI
jgi:hypothetical protein